MTGDLRGCVPGRGGNKPYEEQKIVRGKSPPLITMVTNPDIINQLKLCEQRVLSVQAVDGRFIRLVADDGGCLDLSLLLILLCARTLLCCRGKVCILHSTYTPYMYSTCTVHTQYIQSSCTVHTQFMHSTYTVHAQYIHSTCTVHTHSTCTVHALTRVHTNLVVV